MATLEFVGEDGQLTGVKCCEVDEKRKPIAGTEWCMFLHEGYCVSGSAIVQAEDGSQTQVGPGDGYVIQPGHDAWVVGDEPWITIDWQPSTAFWENLRSGEAAALDPSAPYPFYLASPLEAQPATLGDISQWLIEWKWDGIRGQLIRRAGQCFVWSRGEDLVTDRFPEIVAAAASLPDGTVLDGELVAWRDGIVQPFADLQQRIGRKKLTAQILEQVPVRFLAYDLIEHEGNDMRSLSMRERREKLEALLAGVPEIIRVSPAVSAVNWTDLEVIRDQSRSRGVEGLMLKALDSPYGTGRQRGSWWKWKIEPYSFDAVMLYAQPGHGRRSNLYTDYTFGVWRDGELVPVAKAYSGLSNREIESLDRWIRAHTQEKFGPVRKVEPSQVFELAYEGIAVSTRHKSGIALRFPRILRWRTDKPASEADTLANLQAMLTPTADEPGRSG